MSWLNYSWIQTPIEMMDEGDAGQGHFYLYSACYNQIFLYALQNPRAWLPTSNSSHKTSPLTGKTKLAENEEGPLN